jgi:hypothetical protein
MKIVIIIGLLVAVTAAVTYSVFISKDTFAEECDDFMENDGE